MAKLITLANVNGVRIAINPALVRYAGDAGMINGAQCSVLHFADDDDYIVRGDLHQVVEALNS